MCENPGKVDMPAALAGNPQGRKGEAEQEAWSDGYAAGQADEAEDAVKLLEEERGRAFEQGLEIGKVVGVAIIAAFHALHDRTVFCSNNPYDAPDHPAGPRVCDGQNFWHPEDPNAPCWRCGQTDY